MNYLSFTISRGLNLKHIIECLSFRKILLSYQESCWSSATYDLWLKAESWSFSFEIHEFLFKLYRNYFSSK